MFQPIQIASTVALNGPEDDVIRIREIYRERIGWHTPSPKATMFVWARIPEEFRKMGSVEFAKLLLQEAHVAVSPGLGVGSYGDEYVRFALIENEHRTRQAISGMRRLLSGTAE